MTLLLLKKYYLTEKKSLEILKTNKIVSCKRPARSDEVKIVFSSNISHSVMVSCGGGEWGRAYKDNLMADFVQLPCFVG